MIRLKEEKIFKSERRYFWQKANAIKLRDCSKGCLYQLKYLYFNSVRFSKMNYFDYEC